MNPIWAVNKDYSHHQIFFFFTASWSLTVTLKASGDIIKTVSFNLLRFHSLGYTNEKRNQVFRFDQFDSAKFWCYVKNTRVD